jgi:hypothetical protein
VYDTLDITVSTFAVDASSAAYETWVDFTAFDVSEIIIADGGAGYDSNVANITVTISGTQAQGQLPVSPALMRTVQLLQSV